MTIGQLKPLPPTKDIESKRVLKATIEASRRLGELRGASKTIPNEDILLNTLLVSEARSSSEIENIITTHQDVFRANSVDNPIDDPAIKEVLSYSKALRMGVAFVKDNGFISKNALVDIQSQIVSNNAGIRKQAGTKLIKDSTGEIIYTPPQKYNKIMALLDNLEDYINDKSDSVDHLIRMAVIHSQFESIHPFYDGNGRTGRILNIIYLILAGHLDMPILYLSRFIIRNKTQYYNLLREVNYSENWEDWILFILEGVAQTSEETTILIGRIRDLMIDFKHELRDKYKVKFYSKDLLENLFKHPYTKINFLMEELKISYSTARRYLEQIADIGLLTKEQFGKGGENYYVNQRLLQLFIEHGQE
jgi:Fic family protein